MKINEVIFKRRKELKMTQKDLADKLNVTDKTVSRWENVVAVECGDFDTAAILADGTMVSVGHNNFDLGAFRLW